MNRYYDPWIGEWCMAWRPVATWPLEIYIARLRAVTADGADFGSDPKTPMSRVEGTFIGSSWRHRTVSDEWAEVFKIEEFDSGDIREVLIYQHSETSCEARRLTLADFLNSFDFMSGGGV